ncbi:MAG: DUF5681 domain-containing protein [Bacteroidota bacterium]
MPFKKGESGNPEGRPPGTKNKVNQEIRERINNFLDENFETIESDFLALEPKDRARFYTELLQYGAPKLKAIEMTNDSEAVSHEDLDLILQMLADVK